jgi:hypothetical protein
VDSTAGDIYGDFPLLSSVADIWSGGGRANNYTIDYTDDVIDDGWEDLGATSEGSVWDDWPWERRSMANGNNIRNTYISDNGTWLNFFVRMRGNLASNIHVYIDSDNDGNVEYDLVYDQTNGTVLLYEYNATSLTWSSVSLDSTDRFDQTGNRLEMGIELYKLGLTNMTGNTLRYHVRSEPNLAPGGPYHDAAPGTLGLTWWSGTYTTIPEFQDLIIPVAGSILLFSYLRRRNVRKQNVTKNISRKEEKK